MKTVIFILLGLAYCQGQPGRCSIDGSSATLPACISKYFKNGVLIDGNGKTCSNSKRVIASKTTIANLLAKGEAAVKASTCQKEQGGGPPGGGGGRGKRQARPGGQSCGTGVGVGNCENSTHRLQSLYAEKDLGNSILIVSNGVPGHCYREGADQNIPNVVCENFRAMLVPKSATKSSTFTDFSMGIVGIAKSGAFFFNHLSAESSCNVAAITEKPTFDTCDGHASPFCQYHYHKAPNCIPGFDSCGLLGYTNDGVSIYGKCSLSVNGKITPMKSCYKLTTGKNGCDKSHYTYDASTPGCNLDKANGYYFNVATTTSSNKTFAAKSYGYFFTPEYPFIMPGYYGNKSQAKWCVVSV